MEDVVNPKTRAATTEPLMSTVAPLLFSTLLKQMRKTYATGYRWRKKGWIKTVNIGGALYVMPAALAEFCGRAEAGEFAKEASDEFRTVWQRRGKKGGASCN